MNFDISDSLGNSQLNDSPPTKATQMSDAPYHQFSKDENMTEKQYSIGGVRKRTMVLKLKRKTDPTTKLAVKRQQKIMKM